MSGLTQGSDNPHSAPFSPAEFARAGRENPAGRGADLTPALKRLLAGGTLSADETTEAFEAMMTGRVHHGEMGALLALLATRTPTSEEIIGAATVMRRHVDRVVSDVPAEEIVDTAGTGGAPKTFNVSTAAALVAAGAGVHVAKHGNRSRTGRGSAEVLAALGVNVEAGRSVQRRCLEEARVCFCFAVSHHPATRHVMPVRQALGFPTIFNLLGPLTNPAGARRQLIGVYDGCFLEPIAHALRELGTVHAMVVHSEDGLDELSISAATNAWIVRDGVVSRERIDPEALGLARSERETVVARDLEGAARMIREILAGKEQGAPRAMTLLNAAAAIHVGGAARTLEEGIARAKESLDSGSARHTLEHLAALSHEAAPPENGGSPRF